MITKKLLVISAGTVAAGVGQKLLQQLKTHPDNQLLVMPRYIDTVQDLQEVHGGINPDDWTSVPINRSYMEFVMENRKTRDPKLLAYLYPGLYASTNQAGGGGIRYNGAGAVLMNYKPLRDWLESSMAGLAQRDENQIEMAIAIVVSAVGATGSGSLERLLDIIFDAATRASLPEDTPYTIFILQPGMQGASDLGLANTVSLYAEMAASHLAQAKIVRVRRTVMVGWGSKRMLGNIDQLQEATATLIRVMNAPVSTIKSKYQSSAVDHAALSETDNEIPLPTHLSTATAVTISLGSLETQIIRHDTLRVLNAIVFGDSHTKNTPPPNLAHEAMSEALRTLEPREGYQMLRGRIAQTVDLSSFGNAAQIVSQIMNFPAQQRAGKLNQRWLEDKKKLRELDPNKNPMLTRAEEFAKNTQTTILRKQQEYLATSFSLEQIRAAFYGFKSLMRNLVTEAEGSAIVGTDDDTVQGVLARPLAKESEIAAALSLIQSNLNKDRALLANVYALRFLRTIEGQCDDSISKLSALLSEAHQKLGSDEAYWNNPEPTFTIDVGHPLRIPAFSAEQIKTYYQDVTVFAARSNERRPRSILVDLEPDQRQREDPLAHFRNFLSQNAKLDLPFEEDFLSVWDVIHEYTSTRVHDKVQASSILEVLLKADKTGGVLEERLKQAAERAASLVSFNQSFARSAIQQSYIGAWYRDEDQKVLQEVIDHTFQRRHCELFFSQDRTEIVVLYYVDGLAASSIPDLTGRCLEEFLKYRKKWTSLIRGGNNGQASGEDLDYTFGRIPVYSGRDAEQLVCEKGIIQMLYKVKDKNVVKEYSPEDVPELGEDKQSSSGEASK